MFGKKLSIFFISYNHILRKKHTIQINIKFFIVGMMILDIKGITVFKIFIWGGISSIIPSEIQLYGDRV